MKRYNVLLCIVDCLRYDKALEMQALIDLGLSDGGHWFANHWATSHCTDPCMMHMLSGRHPDDLRLYSMMFDDKKYDIPEGVETIFDMANEYGYETAFMTNLQRWYSRGVKHFSDTRGANIGREYANTERLIKDLKQPWLIVLHTDDCHAGYTGGTYDSAVKYTNGRIQRLIDLAGLENTVVMITADHGEGLGQHGPDKQRIDQHGSGLWEFLTHIPLVAHVPQRPWMQAVDALTDHGSVYQIMSYVVRSKQLKAIDKDLVYQAGATPRVFHRGVVDWKHRQFVRATTKEGHKKYWVGCEEGDDGAQRLEVMLARHCDAYGLEYGDVDEEEVIIERLKGLGYWSE